MFRNKKLKRAIAVMLVLFLSAAPLIAKINASAVKYYRYAMKYHRKGNYKNAITYYNVAVKKERKFWQAWLGLGICYYNLKKYRNARLIFRYVMTLKPGETTAKKYYEILNPKAKAAKENKKDDGPKTKGDLMWRSALLPGLGQFYNGELIKGYLYSLGFLVSISAIIKYTLDQQDAVNAYETTNVDFADKWDTAEEANWRIYVPIGTAGVIWVVSILDAFMSGADEKPGKFVADNMILRNQYTVAYNLVDIKF